jgi:hypothetical protein
MCNPLLAASAALTAAGGAASLYGQNQQQRAYSSVENAQARAMMNANRQAMALRQAERDRQTQLTNQSQNLLGQSVAANSMESQAAQEAELANSLGAKYGASADKASEYSNIPGLGGPANEDGNQVVSEVYKNAFGNVKKFLGQQAQSKAVLDAYGNMAQGQNIANARQLQQQGVLGNFMQNNNSVLANELTANSENSQIAQAKAAMSGNNALQQAAMFNGLGSIGMNLGIQGLSGGLGGAMSKAPYGSSFTPQLGPAHLFTPKAGAL